MITPVGFPLSLNFTSLTEFQRLKEEEEGHCQAKVLIFIYLYPMYYRRKILLSLLQVSGNKLDKISLQKLLFLFTQQQEVKSYHFVPYKFGCFSFQANADLHTMTKYRQVLPSMKYWQKIDNKNYLDELKIKTKGPCSSSPINMGL